MNTPKQEVFKKGQTVYLPNGQQAEYIAKMPDGNHLVSYAFENPDTGDIYFEGMGLYTQIFKKAPIEKLEERVKLINDRIAALLKEETALTRKIFNYETELRGKEEKNKALTERIFQYDGLELLDQFIQGQITHYVYKRWLEVEIIEFSNATCDSANSYDRIKELKLLSLYGNSKGDLAWKLNKYKDGSGNDCEAYPCCSFEEALVKAKELIYQAFEVIRKDKRMDHAEVNIKSCKKLNIEVPEDIIIALKDYNLEKRRKDIEVQKKVLLEKEAELSVYKKENP